MALTEAALKALEQNAYKYGFPARQTKKRLLLKTEAGTARAIIKARKETNPDECLTHEVEQTPAGPMSSIYIIEVDF